MGMIGRNKLKMLNGKKYPMKRREMLLVLFLLVAGIFTVLFFKFFSRNRAVDLATLPLFGERMDELAETIIPETNTPGAKSAGVGATVLLLVEYCLSTQEQSAFLKGMADIDEYCERNFGHVFTECEEQERLKTLSYFESRANFGGRLVTKVRHRLFGRPFIVLVKELTVIAYCRSFQGATEALVYDPVPTQYIGCMVMDKGQHSWALI